MGEKYYNGSNVLNNNCTMNFLIGNRSTGKSFYWKRYCVRQFLEKGRRFVYIRRREADLKLCLPTWFDDIAFKFTGWHYRYKGNKLFLYQMDTETGDVTREEVIGYAFYMTDSTRLKSLPLDTVDTIFFDEFLPDNMQYIKPSIPMFEPEQLESIFLTIARGPNQVIRTNVKVICVSNATTRYSPYFAYYDIDLTSADKWKRGGVYAEIYFNDEIANEIENSFEFGKTLANGTYGRHALRNEFLRDTEGHIEKHPKASVPLMQLYFKRWYVIYGDFKNDLLYADEGYDKTFKRNFTLTEHPFDFELPILSGDALKILKRYLTDDKIYFENMKVKVFLLSALSTLCGRRL